VAHESVTAYPVSRFKKDDKKEKKVILAVGLLIAVVLAVAGTQMSVSGREYARKVKLLEARGYEIDGRLAWGDMEEWEESIKRKYKKENTKTPSESRGKRSRIGTSSTASSETP